MGVGAATIGDVIVAIDGGNSKTDVAIVALDGTVLAEMRGPGASQHVYGTRQAVLAIEKMVRAVLATAGYSLGQREIRHTAAYLAGVDLPREQAEIMDVVVEHRWSGTAQVDNDTFALLRIGSPTGYGVAVVCGAGINCVAMDDSGRIIRFPSLGSISGDWGGGAMLGNEVMSAAARAEDGRGEATLLQDAVTGHFGAGSVLEVIERLHFTDIPARRLHELSPVLFETAAAGDAVAAALVERLAEEIAAFALVSLRRLGLLATAAPVVFGGSILAARHPMLVDGLERRIGAVAPHAQLHYVSEPPIAGAALLGLDFVGATADPAVELTLREHYLLRLAETPGR